MFDGGGSASGGASGRGGSGPGGAIGSGGTAVVEGGASSVAGSASGGASGRGGSGPGGAVGSGGTAVVEGGASSVAGSASGGASGRGGSGPGGASGSGGSTVDDGGTSSLGGSASGGASGQAGEGGGDLGGAGTGGQSGSVIPDDGSRLVVLPILFVPTDSTLSEDEAARSRSLLLEHMLLAQRRYQLLLQTDTFYFEVRDPAVYQATLTAAQYNQASPDSAHVMTKELLDWQQETRNDSRHVFVALFVRPPDAPCGGEVSCMGGSRPFNGRQGTGGGFTQLEYTSLVSDSPYPFQSTLIHELGHAFGLTHSDCFGEDMNSSVSLMSYDPSHHSQGLVESATPGVFLPEEYYLLDLANQAFPSFVYDATTHNPTNKTLVNVEGQCEIGAMDGSIGPMERLGYQLFWDGSLVSGPDAQFYTLGGAKDNCQWNIDTYADSKVIRCLYDGVLIGTNE
jgi:hypothetical protein